MTVRDRLLLVLEDEPIVGLALEDMIEEAGGRCLYAERLQQARGFIADQPIDAAILDINVHGELSYPVAEVLTERAIPFIFATGYGDTLHPEKFRGVPTITKPYTFADVERALQRTALGA